MIRHTGRGVQIYTIWAIPVCGEANIHMGSTCFLVSWGACGSPGIVLEPWRVVLEPGG
jgi:hypothetical protein